MQSVWAPWNALTTSTTWYVQRPFSIIRPLLFSSTPSCCLRLSGPLWPSSALFPLFCASFSEKCYKMTSYGEFIRGLCWYSTDPMRRLRMGGFWWVRGRDLLLWILLGSCAQDLLRRLGNEVSERATIQHRAHLFGRVIGNLNIIWPPQNPIVSIMMTIHNNLQVHVWRLAFRTFWNHRCGDKQH